MNAFLVIIALALIIWHSIRSELWIRSLLSTVKDGDLRIAELEYEIRILEKDPMTGVLQRAAWEKQVH